MEISAKFSIFVSPKIIFNSIYILNILYFFFIKIGKTQVIEHLERENQNIISHYDQIIRTKERKQQDCEAKLLKELHDCKEKLLKACDLRGITCCVCSDAPAHAPKNCGHKSY